MSDHLTARQHRDLIAGLAAEALKEHVLTRRPDGSWRCGNANGSSNYAFSIFFAPGMVAVWGDLGEFVIRHFDGDSLGWLLRATKDGEYPDYLLGKIQALHGDQEELHYAEAMAHLAELENALPKCQHCPEAPARAATCLGRYEDEGDGDDDDAYACDECCGHGDEDGHCEPVSVKERGRIGAVRAAMEAVAPESAASHQDAWWTAWSEQGDGDPPSCTGWSSGPLWLWQMARCFRRLHAALTEAEKAPPPVPAALLPAAGVAPIRVGTTSPCGCEDEPHTCTDGGAPTEHEMVVNRHQMQNLLERFADLLDGGGAGLEFVESDRDGSAWVHDPAAPHPCDYACGAVHIERTPAKITAQMGNVRIEFLRGGE